IPTAIAHPIPKGRTIPTVLTPSATRIFRNIIRRSTSNPTMNRKKTRPRLATRFKFGRAAAGKMVSENPGILPITLEEISNGRENEVDDTMDQEEFLL